MVDYGLRQVGAEVAERNTCLFLHGTSRDDKRWPDDQWVALGRLLAPLGIAAILPWGSDSEKRRSDALADQIPGAQVPSRLSINEIARVMHTSKFVVGVDTGLTHLAAALGCPVAALYVASDPAKTGVHGASMASNLGHPGLSPRPQDVVDVLARFRVL